jgi:hypothetical protein
LKILHRTLVENFLPDFDGETLNTCTAPGHFFQNRPRKSQRYFLPQKPSASMPDEHIPGFCTKCGAQNPEKNRICPGCGASLVVTDNSPAMAPLQNSIDKGKGGKNRQTTLLVAGAAIIVLLVATLLMSGFLASLFPWMVVGTYRQGDDTFGLALSEIKVNADGTFSEGLLSRGTWRVEGNRFRVAYTKTRLIQKPCIDAIIPLLCPVESVQVPSGTVKYWNIGWNTITQDGVVWHKGETGALGMWRNY